MLVKFSNEHLLQVYSAIPDRSKGRGYRYLVGDDVWDEGKRNFKKLQRDAISPNIYNRSNAHGLNVVLFLI